VKDNGEIVSAFNGGMSGCQNNSREMVQLMAGMPHGTDFSPFCLFLAHDCQSATYGHYDSLGVCDVA
jgi:hypothetical protein